LKAVSAKIVAVLDLLWRSLHHRDAAFAEDFFRNLKKI
jgi:hypothetical protein